MACFKQVIGKGFTLELMLEYASLFDSLFVLDLALLGTQPKKFSNFQYDLHICQVFQVERAKLPPQTKVVSLTKLLNSSHFLFACQKEISLKIFYVNEVMTCIIQRKKAKHGVTQIGPDSYYNYSCKKSITYNLASSTNISQVVF